MINGIRPALAFCILFLSFLGATQQASFAHCGLESLELDPGNPFPYKHLFQRLVTVGFGDESAEEAPIHQASIEAVYDSEGALTGDELEQEVTRHKQKKCRKKKRNKDKRPPPKQASGGTSDYMQAYAARKASKKKKRGGDDNQ